MNAAATEIASQVPWWFTSAAAVTGVVVGILLKWLIDAITEGRRRAREDRLRFLNECRDGYLAFLRQVVRYRDLIEAAHTFGEASDEAALRSMRKFPELRPAADLYHKELFDPGAELNDDPDQLLSDILADLMAELAASVRSMDLFAPKDVTEAASKVVEAAGEEQAYEEAHDNFMNLVRRHLGVPDQ